jgi:hypothetical protein
MTTVEGGAAGREVGKTAAVDRQSRRLQSWRIICSSKSEKGAPKFCAHIFINTVESETERGLSRTWYFFNSSQAVKIEKIVYF